MITGTAVLLLAAGVMLQVMRPPSGFSEDGSPAGAAPAGRASTAEQGPKRDKKIAKVGKKYISYEELAAECIRRIGKETLDNLINREIIQQACDEMGIEISEAEVTKAIEKQAKDLGLTADQLLQMNEVERNISPAQFRRDAVWPMLALRKIANEDVKVSEEDIKKAFIRNYGPRVKARAIVLDNSRRASEVWQKAQDNPEDFERLVKQYSVDPSSRPLEGVIPPIQRYAGSKELENVAFKLKEGEISGVVQVGLNHYIILKCEGRTDPLVKDIAEVRDILIQELKEEKIHVAVARTFEKLKNEARVDNYLTYESTGGERRPGGGKAAGNAGAINQTSATGPHRTASQIPNDSAPARSPAKAGGKSPAGMAPKTAVARE
ncbi:MAG: peptidylprolyl isomerase [Deltaproteobacteria bacterium]